jgi:hypothetical protein
MTFLKRSLDLPGVTIVLAYVEPILRHKAFNPLTIRLPDLADSVDAHLLEQLTASELSEDEVSTAVGQAEQGKDGQLSPAALRNCLLRAFAKLPAHRRQVIQLGLAEKYLISEPIVMGRTRDTDLQAVPLTFPSIRRRLERLGSVPPTEWAPSAMSDALAVVRERDPVWSPPSLRHIEGALNRVMAYLELDGSTSQLTAEQIAVVFAISLRLSTLYGIHAGLEGPSLAPASGGTDAP